MSIEISSFEISVLDTAKMPSTTCIERIIIVENFDDALDYQHYIES